MNVSLTSELEQFVARKVGSGRYTSASEVVRAALRLLEERDEERSAQWRRSTRSWASGWSRWIVASRWTGHGAETDRRQV